MKIFPNVFVRYYIFDEVEDILGERRLYRLNVADEGVEKVACGTDRGMVGPQ